MGLKVVCQEHERLRYEAVAAVLEAKRIRWSNDLSFHQDSEISSDQHRKIDALLKHLLVGHDGKPCPGGDRPIVTRFHAADCSQDAPPRPLRPRDHSSLKSA
ncbi:MAG: hypothetical protein WA211_00410 [Candidatus Acidiferrales bacterium]